MSSLLRTLEMRILLADGAMGTQLQAAGLEPGACGEMWNIEAPERVLAIQREYVEAGSDCLITHTFGASRIMLNRHDVGNRTVEINRAAVKIAREAFGRRSGFVLGDIGPFGGLMEPFGETSRSEVADAFEEQAGALVDGGVDAIIVETQTSLDELGIAIDAALKANAPCVIGSMAFDLSLDGSEARTMMGTTPAEAARFMKEAGVHVVALNCGTGIDMKWAARILEQYRSVVEMPLMAQPNAGKPELENLRVVYRETPEETASGLADLVLNGARIVGGCCGTTPDHIGAMRRKLDTITKVETT